MTWRSFASSTTSRPRSASHVEWLTGAEARRREPYLHPNVPAALFSPDDHQVDNRRVGEALARALRAAGGRLHEECPIEAIDVANGRAQGVRAGGRDVGADHVVLAAGAWSRSIGGLPAAACPPVRPIKGQMLALAMDPDAPLLRHVLWAGGVYLVPRRDGRLIVGGTTEERGFDTRLTAGAMLSLLHGAWRAIPGDGRTGDRRELGGVSARFARRCADPGTMRGGAAGHRHRPSSQRHSADPDHGADHQPADPDRERPIRPSRDFSIRRFEANHAEHSPER